MLSDEGYIAGLRVEGTEAKPELVLELRYNNGGTLIIDSIQRISKPGRRVYVAAGEVPQVRSGLGIAIMSTSKGVMTDSDARAAGIGGEVMCEVW